jgi:hypothetical protein
VQRSLTRGGQQTKEKTQIDDDDGNEHDEGDVDISSGEEDGNDRDDD